MMPDAAKLEGAVTGQEIGCFVLALAEYEGKNGNGPATMKVNGASLRCNLVRRFYGDFHRVTCRSDGDLNENSHTGFHLSRTSRRLIHVGRSYLVPKSFGNAVYKTVVFCTSPGHHFNVLCVALNERMYMAHKVLSFTNCNSRLLKFLPNFLGRKPIWVIRQDSSDCVEWPRGIFHGMSRFRVELPKSVSDHSPSVDLSLDARFLALKLRNLFLGLSELLLWVHPKKG